MTDELKFIKMFQKITLTKVCKNLGISRSNIVSGGASRENYIKIKKEIEKEIAKIYLEIYGSDSNE